TQAAISGGTTTNYAYDGDGKRMCSSTPCTTPEYVYDVSRGLPVILQDGTKQYVWGQGLAYSVSGPTIAVHHNDGLGSTRATTTTAGQVESSYLTDDFGVSKLIRGTSPARMQYTGEPRDSETGFVYLRARMYDPAVGRFLQRDPYPGSIADPQSLHRVTYVHNSPTGRIDPSGLIAVPGSSTSGGGTSATKAKVLGSYSTQVCDHKYYCTTVDWDANGGVSGISYQCSNGATVAGFGTGGAIGCQLQYAVIWEWNPDTGTWVSVKSYGEDAWQSNSTLQTAPNTPIEGAGAPGNGKPKAVTIRIKYYEPRNPTPSPIHGKLVSESRRLTPRLIPTGAPASRTITTMGGLEKIRVGERNARTRCGQDRLSRSVRNEKINCRHRSDMLVA
ncbi:MAG: RHS repeat-associated core domain-containing protein, partial [Chloroflexota bacterium]